MSAARSQTPPAAPSCATPAADNAVPTEVSYPLVLWDGDCGFCARSVEWALRHGAGATLTFLPYQRSPSPPMTAELAAACARAVHLLLADGTVLRAGRAGLYVLERAGWGRAARWLARPPMVWLVEAAYRIVAANRRLFDRLLFHGGAAPVGGSRRR